MRHFSLLLKHNLHVRPQAPNMTRCWWLQEWCWGSYGFCMVWKHSIELDIQHMLICKMLCTRWNFKKSQRSQKSKSQWKSHKSYRSWWRKLKTDRGLVFDQVFDQVLSAVAFLYLQKIQNLRHTIWVIVHDTQFSLACQRPSSDFWKVEIGFAPCLSELFGWMQTDIQEIIHFLSIF